MNDNKYKRRDEQWAMRTRLVMYFLRLIDAARDQRRCLDPTLPFNYVDPELEPTIEELWRVRPRSMSSNAASNVRPVAKVMNGLTERLLGSGRFSAAELSKIWGDAYRMQPADRDNTHLHAQHLKRLGARTLAGIAEHAAQMPERRPRQKPIGHGHIPPAAPGLT